MCCFAAFNVPITPSSSTSEPPAIETCMLAKHTVIEGSAICFMHAGEFIANYQHSMLRNKVCTISTSTGALYRNALCIGLKRELRAVQLHEMQFSYSHAATATAQAPQCTQLK